MRLGAWFHTADGAALDEQLERAAQQGLTAARSYSIGYAQEAAPALRRLNLSLLAGMHIDTQELLRDWRSQVRLTELAAYRAMGLTLDGICVGNELREGGDEPDKKRFTARLSFALANVSHAYRAYMREQGWQAPLTYAMEGIVVDSAGKFHEWVWPLIDACDVVGMNLYPMGPEAWFTFGAFEQSRRFLRDARVRHDRLAEFEFMLRRVLQQLATAGKPLILTETGFPSAQGYHMEGERHVVPEHDASAFGEAMVEFVTLIARANAEYRQAIQTVLFYEWRDNLYHSKIWNVEQSPIHTAFGLCDRSGVPKLDVRALVKIAAG